MFFYSYTNLPEVFTTKYTMDCGGKIVFVMVCLKIEYVKHLMADCWLSFANVFPVYYIYIYSII